MGCQTCTSHSIKYEIQSYFSSAINTLNLHNIKITEFLSLIQEYFNIENSPIKFPKANLNSDINHNISHIEKSKYNLFISNMILSNYKPTEESMSSVYQLSFPDYLTFLKTYFNRLYDNFNFGLEQVIFFFMFFINNEKFQTDKQVKTLLEDILIELMFVNKKDCMTFTSFKTMLSEVVYNIIVLPAVCLYLSSNEFVKSEIQSLLEASYRKERINSYVMSELKVLDLYTFFTKDDLRKFISHSEFEIHLFERMITLYSWEMEQLLNGFNVHSNK